MSELYAVVALVGLWGWVGSVVVFILRAFPAKGVFRGRAALAPSVAFLVFFVLWLVGMSHA